MAKKKLPEVPDAQVLNGGSVFLVTPHTDAAREWIKKNVGEEAQFFGYSLVVEHRYIDDLVEGMCNDGLIVKPT